LGCRVRLPEHLPGVGGRLTGAGADAALDGDRRGRRRVLRRMGGGRPRRGERQVAGAPRARRTVRRGRDLRRGRRRQARSAPVRRRPRAPRHLSRRRRARRHGRQPARARRPGRRRRRDDQRLDRLVAALPEGSRGPGRGARPRHPPAARAAGRPRPARTGV
ncbi:MAG: hypothetical protein AVDCRST_MAG79-533, partial [uncultured Thermoleophilia bacterium]